MTSLVEAIDQLFGYTAWRDTKLALIIEKARDVLVQHPQFVEGQDAASETELRAKMSWPGDERRLADLNVFFIHTPSETS